MAGSLTDAAEVEILKLLTGQATSLFQSGGTPYTPYVALFTATPTDVAATGTEATGGGYARITSAGKWGAPTGTSTVSNNAVISFAAFTGSVSSGAPFTAFALFDAVTAGNRIAWGTLTDQTKTGGNGDTVSFASGSLTITAD